MSTRKQVDQILTTNQYFSLEFKRSMLQLFIQPKGTVLIKNNNYDFVDYITNSFSGKCFREKMSKYFFEDQEKPKCVQCNSSAKFNYVEWKYSDTCGRACSAIISGRNKRKPVKANDFKKYIRNMGPFPAITILELQKMIEKSHKQSNTSSWMLIFKNKYKDFYNHILSISDGDTPTEKIYRFINKTGKGMCETCGNPTSFKGILMGYRPYCNSKCANNSNKIRLKIKNTNIERYGVESPMQKKEFLIAQQMSGFNRKLFVFSSGRSIGCQGNEPEIINYLLAQGEEENNITQDAPVVKYRWVNKISVHFPDLYLVNSKTIIEVKSPYTFKKYLDKNLAKMKGAIESGYNYKFYIWYRKTETVKIISTVEEFMVWVPQS